MNDAPFLAGHSTMLLLFMNQGSETAMGIGTQFLHVAAPFYFVVAAKLIIDGVLRGSGAMKYFMIDTFSDLILRVVLAFVLSVPFGTLGIWLSWPIGWVIGTALAVVFYAKGVWKQKSLTLS